MYTHITYFRRKWESLEFKTEKKECNVLKHYKICQPALISGLTKKDIAIKHEITLCKLAFSFISILFVCTEHNCQTKTADQLSVEKYQKWRFVRKPETEKVWKRINFIISSNILVFVIPCNNLFQHVCKSLIVEVILNINFCRRAPDTNSAPM